jgi:competence protein ComEC
VVDITGWTLSDAQGNEFVFPEQRLFTNGSITVYTRAGEDTPVVLYWGRSTAVWGDEGDVATLTDANGRVQSSVRVNGDE